MRDATASSGTRRVLTNGQLVLWRFFANDHLLPIRITGINGPHFYVAQCDP